LGVRAVMELGVSVVKDRDDHIYRATDYDPIRSSEICLQCPLLEGKLGGLTRDLEHIGRN